MKYFNSDNCDYSPAQRAWANAYANEWLFQHGDADGLDADLVKSACDAANDALPEFEGKNNGN